MKKYWELLTFFQEKLSRIDKKLDTEVLQYEIREFGNDLLDPYPEAIRIIVNSLTGPL